jgi:hypothetical protein
MVIGIRFLNGVLSHSMYRMEDRSVGGMLARLLLGEFWGEVPIRAAGHLWYLTVATGGLFVIGVAVAARAAWRAGGSLRHGSWPIAGEGAQAYSIVAAAALLAISVIGMTDVSRPLQRLDHLIYGRYNDSFGVFFLMLGVAYMLERWSGERASTLGTVRYPAVSALAVLALTALVLQVGGARLLASGQPYAPISAIGIAVYAGEATMLPVAVATLGGAILVVLSVVILPRISPYLSVGLLCASFLAMSWIAETEVLRSYNSQWMNLLSLHHSVRHVGEPALIGYDEDNLSLHGLNGYQFWLDDVDFVTFDSGASDNPPDVDLVIAAEEWDQAGMLGARLASIEPRLDQGLWVLPGATQDAMGSKGQLLPRDPTSELPPEGMSSNLEIIRGPEPGASVTANTSSLLRLRIQHLGGGSPWIPLGAWAPDPVTGATRLVARWIPAGQADVAALQIAELPRTVLPGEEVEVEIEVTPSTEDGPLAPGEYVLRLGLVQEGYGWFEASGDPQVDLALEVVEAR